MLAVLFLLIPFLQFRWQRRAQSLCVAQIDGGAADRAVAQPEALASGAANLSATVVTTEKLPQASDVVTFAARTESWVEVADAKGNVILRRTLVAGDVVGASGELPLKIVVGRADATQVQIRGKAFDLNAVAKDNVAKFEVR